MNRMKMIYQLLLVLACLPATLQAQPKNVIVQHLQGLFLSPKTPLQKGANCMVITKEKDFAKTFGLTAAQAHAPNMPNFEKENILILALPPDNKDADLDMTTAVTAGNFMEIQCYVKRKIYPLSYTTHPLVVVTVPKFKGVNTYRFYEGRKILTTVSIK